MDLLNFCVEQEFECGPVFLSHKSIDLNIEIIQLQITFFEILQIIRVPQERDQSIFGRHVCPGAISAYITGNPSCP